MDPSFSTSHRADAQSLAAVHLSCLVLAEQPDRFEAVLSAQLRESLGHERQVGPALTRLGVDVAGAVLSSITSTAHAATLESYWQSVGSRYAAQSPGDDIFPAVFQALVRTARELCVDDWSSALSSDWAAMRLWVLEHLTAGADRSRALGAPLRVVTEPDRPDRPDQLDQRDQAGGQAPAGRPDGRPEDGQPDEGRRGRSGRGDRKRRQRGDAIDDLWLP
jgi:hypothetical protein